jgi:hypothetical protein
MEGDGFVAGYQRVPSRGLGQSISMGTGRLEFQWGWIADRRSSTRGTARKGQGRARDVWDAWTAAGAERARPCRGSGLGAGGAVRPAWVAASTTAVATPDARLSSCRLVGMVTRWP